MDPARVVHSPRHEQLNNMSDSETPELFTHAPELFTHTHTCSLFSSPAREQLCRNQYLAGNLQAAGIILSDAERYGGSESGLVRWARLVTERAQPTITGPLFEGDAGSPAEGCPAYRTGGYAKSLARRRLDQRWPTT